jgi:hypothetical protein
MTAWEKKCIYTDYNIKAAMRGTYGIATGTTKQFYK